MQCSPEELYLDLLKKTLSFTLWPERPVPTTVFNYRRPFLKRSLVQIISTVLEKKGLLLAKKRYASEEERTEGKVWPCDGDTMIGLKRLDNLQHCVETVIREDVAGDLIETGVWRGGACIFMRGVLVAYGIKDRRVFVADSFEGLPKPNEEKYPADRSDKLHTEEFLCVSQEVVRKNFERYGLLDEQVVFLKGWFKQTLPNAPIEKLSVLRLDGDMYESTMDALGILYPKLSQGGFCIIDDYGLQGCKKAVDDYRAQQQINDEMKVIDWTGRYWRKS